MKDIFTPGLDLILSNAPVKLGFRMDKNYSHCRRRSAEGKLTGGWGHVDECANASV